MGYPINSSEIVFHVPSYDGPEGKVSVRLTSAAGGSVDFAGQGSPTFEYISEWETLLGSFPSLWHPPS
eukprot:1562593-Rhodomonas_salina.1